jgi:hypothetical protein
MSLARTLAVQAPSDRPSWVVPFGATAPTAATDLVAIENQTGVPSPGIIRLMRVVIWQVGQQTTPGNVGLQIVRTKTAGVGSTVTPVRIGNRAAAGAPVFAGICRAGNAGANLGTADDVIATESPWVPAAAAAMQPIVFEMGGQGLTYEAPTAIPGAGNGIALRHPGAAGATAWTGYAVFTVDPY